MGMRATAGESLDGFETWRATGDQHPQIVAVSYGVDGTCRLGRGAMEFLLGQAGYTRTDEIHTAALSGDGGEGS